MHRTILASASIAALGVSTAMAGNLDPRPAPPFWTGAYVGLSAGYGWGHSDGSVVPHADAIMGSDFPVPSLNPKGFIGGGQIGYNWQTGSLVLGAELDFSGMNVKPTNA